MDFTLRRAGLDDLDAVMALETAGFVPGIVEDRGVFARRIGAFPEGFLVARTADGLPLGYLCAELWSGWTPRGTDPDARGRFDLGHDIADYLDREGDTLYIASMTVAPEFRGDGTGRDLFCRSLETLKTAFPQIRQVVLIVNEHWSGARRIYAGEGFIEIARLPSFFQPDGGPVGDAVLMVRP